MNPLELARRIWRAEPVRTAGYLAALVVFVAAKLGVVIDEQDLVTSLLLILPVVLGVEKARGEVMPVTHLARSNVYVDDDKGDRNAKRSRPK